MKTPQLILTLSPSGALQIELPSTNGSRQVENLEELDSRSASAEEIVEKLKRILAWQALGQTSIGQAGAPTSWQLRRPENLIAEGNCPFCSLGLPHSPYYCDNIPREKKTKKRTLSPATKAILKQYATVPLSPEELGL